MSDEALYASTLGLWKNEDALFTSTLGLWRSEDVLFINEEGLFMPTLGISASISTSSMSATLFTEPRALRACREEGVSGHRAAPTEFTEECHGTSDIEPVEMEDSSFNNSISPLINAFFFA